MTPNAIVKHNDGRMLAVVWPEEPKCKKHCEYTGVCEVFATPTTDPECKCEAHKNACEQAIADGIEFSGKEDERKILWAIWDDDAINPFPCPDFDVFELQKMQPYPIPEGFEIETKLAFIKKQAPEQEESQDELWHEIVMIHGDDGFFNIEKLKSRFRIERIK